MSEEEHQRDKQRGGDEKWSREQCPEQLVVILQVHVEHHDNRELECRESQQSGYERARGNDRWDVIHPHFADRDKSKYQRHLPVGAPLRMMLYVLCWIVRDLSGAVRMYDVLFH